MSDLRTAAKQMLEALEGGADSWQLVGPAIDALKEALAAEQGLKPAGVVTSMVKGGVTWHIWPDQMPDGTTLYAAAPIIKPEIKEDNSVPQAQQFLYNAWADEQIQKEKK